jgi:hypothetical protein
MTIRWLDEKPGTVGQPIFPFSVPPIGWPTGVVYPPPQPDWWPSGLQYPPIGEAWAPTPPPWWTNASASLPNWPPPPPAGWPSSFPWPVPPAAATTTMQCPAICDAQFGPLGTTPNEQALLPCKLACGLKPPTTTFPISPGTYNLVETKPGGAAPSTTSATEEKKSNTALIVVAVLAAAGIGAWLLFGSGGLAANPYGRAHLRAMTKAEAKRQFEAYVLPGVEEQYGPSDVPARRQAWNEWVDSLARDGRIT